MRRIVEAKAIEVALLLGLGLAVCLFFVMLIWGVMARSGGDQMVDEKASFEIRDLVGAGVLGIGLFLFFLGEGS
jgi:hypothetical protein